MPTRPARPRRKIVERPGSSIDLDQTHPSVYMRMPDEPPPEFVELAARYLVQGKNRAQILNDTRILDAFRELDVPSEEIITRYRHTG